MIRADLLSSPIKVKVAVPLLEYWKLLGIPFLQERFMKHSIIYVEAAAELIEVSEYVSFNLHVLHTFLGDFQLGTIFVYIIPEEEPTFYE